MQSLQLHLTGATRSWLSKLEKEIIRSWEELTKQFTSNFKSTYKRPASIEEVKACVQQRNETLRAYIQRWSIIKNLAVEVSDERAIDAFIVGLRRGDLWITLICIILVSDSSGLSRRSLLLRSICFAEISLLRRTRRPDWFQIGFRFIKGVFQLDCFVFGSQGSDSWWRLRVLSRSDQISIYRAAEVSQSRSDITVNLLLRFIC
jgi:hypothetical protein